MCFEFEALYWAKIAEEELKKKEALAKLQTQRAPNDRREQSRDNTLDPLQEDPLVV